MTFPPERDERVNHWLDELGLSELADVFARERIDWELLPELGEADLRELGIPLGHRKRLLQGIDGLRAAPPAAVAPAADGAERRLLTVLFSDLVGYTAFGRRLDAQPQVHGIRVQARVGIATGPVVVGRLIGLGTARERSVVGETPSLAARLQSLAMPGAIVVADRTRRLTGGLFADVLSLGRGEIAVLGTDALQQRVIQQLEVPAAEGRLQAVAVVQQAGD